MMASGRRATPTVSLWCSAKPDLDNMVKAVLDALNKSGRWWADDAQVARLIATMAYAEKNGEPRVQVWVEEIEDGPSW